MALHIKELPPEIQRKLKQTAKLRMRRDEVTRHAVAVAALLLDTRNLTASEARPRAHKGRRASSVNSHGKEVRCTARRFGRT